MLEYNISLKFFLCHKMHAKNLKIFNVFLFSKADDKALFCSFFSSLFGRWEAWQCSREWRFPWQKVARKSSWRKRRMSGWWSSYSGTRWHKRVVAQPGYPKMGMGMRVHMSQRWRRSRPRTIRCGCSRWTRRPFTQVWGFAQGRGHWGRRHSMYRWAGGRPGVGSTMGSHWAFQQSTFT